MLTLTAAQPLDTKGWVNKKYDIIMVDSPILTTNHVLLLLLLKMLLICTFLDSQSTEVKLSMILKIELILKSSQILFIQVVHKWCHSQDGGGNGVYDGII